MNKSRALLYIIFTGLLIFTIALGVNNYHAGVYADEHQVDGASVGWFAPNGVLIFASSFAATLIFAAYLFGRKRAQ